MKPQVIALGLSGLVGSRISELLAEKYELVSLTTSSGVDITKPESLTVIKEYRDANFVLHLAAKTDVDGCESDKELGDQGEAWKVNAWGTSNVAEICRETGKKIIYVSTDFVFDGEKPEGDYYTEEDTPNPTNWYAVTKYEGEKTVEKSGADYLILRIAYPYRAKFAIRKDFARSIKERLENNQSVKTVTNHIFCPTFIDDLAGVIDKLIENDLSGIYHAVGASSISPLDACYLIADVFGLNRSLILKTTREEFFKDRAFRPFNLSLSNGKIEKLGVIMRPFDEGLSEIRKQLNS